MGEIEGERKLEHRRNFHGPDGKHLFPHPETYARRSQWSGWDKAYARHLDRHRELIANPEPMKGDPQLVTELFAHIEYLEQIIAKEKLLIRVIRQTAAAGAEPDELEMDDLSRAIRKENGS